MNCSLQFPSEPCPELVKRYKRQSWRCWGGARKLFCFSLDTCGTEASHLGTNSARHPRPWAVPRPASLPFLELESVFPSWGQTPSIALMDGPADPAALCALPRALLSNEMSTTRSLLLFNGYSAVPSPQAPLACCCRGEEAQDWSMRLLQGRERQVLLL